MLVAIPTYQGKDYVFHENWNCVKNFTYPNYEYVYIDNSPTPDYYYKLKRRGANVVRVPRGANSRQALCNAQNWARNKVIRDNYDYLMFVESDLLPTPDAIQRLMNAGKPVVGALYYIGHEIKIPCVFFLDWKGTGSSLGSRLISLREVPTFVGSGLRQVHGMGLGCTLIRGDLVKRFPFWYDERFDNKHSDVYFYMDVHNKGIPVYVDSNYVIVHKPSKWDEVKDK